MNRVGCGSSFKTQITELKRVFLIFCGIFVSIMIMAPVFGSQLDMDGPSLEMGSIDWEKRVVRAKGIGVPPNKAVNPTQSRVMTQRAARIVAYQRLLEVTENIQVDSQTVVKNYILESDVVRTRVSGMVRGAQVVEERAFPDGSYEVTLEMNLKNLDGYLNTQIPSNPNPKSPEFSIRKKPEHHQVDYTGLLINAQGLEISECLFPKIKMSDGQVVYSRDNVQADLDSGIAGYVRGVTEATSHDKVRDNPLIVKALGVDKGNPTDLVIHEADAQLIHLEPKNLEFLREGKVVIAY